MPQCTRCCGRLPDSPIFPVGNQGACGAMSANPAAMQAMAAKYLELAGKTADPGVSEKLRQYAALYRDIATQAVANKEPPTRCAHNPAAPTRHEQSWFRD